MKSLIQIPSVPACHSALHQSRHTPPPTTSRNTPQFWHKHTHARPGNTMNSALPRSRNPGPWVEKAAGSPTPALRPDATGPGFYITEAIPSPYAPLSTSALVQGHRTPCQKPSPNALCLRPLPATTQPWVVHCLGGSFALPTHRGPSFPPTGTADAHPSLRLPASGAVAMVGEGESIPEKNQVLFSCFPLCTCYSPSSRASLSPFLICSPHRRLEPTAARKCRLRSAGTEEAKETESL